MAAVGDTKTVRANAEQRYNKLLAERKNLFVSETKTIISLKDEITKLEIELATKNKELKARQDALEKKEKAFCAEEIFWVRLAMRLDKDGIVVVRDDACEFTDRLPIPKKFEQYFDTEAVWKPVVVSAYEEGEAVHGVAGHTIDWNETVDVYINGYHNIKNMVADDLLLNKMCDWYSGDAMTETNMSRDTDNPWRVESVSGVIIVSRPQILVLETEFGNDIEDPREDTMFERERRSLDKDTPSCNWTSVFADPGTFEYLDS